VSDDPTDTGGAPAADPSRVRVAVDAQRQGPAHVEQDESAELVSRSTGVAEALTGDPPGT